MSVSTSVAGDDDLSECQSTTTISSEVPYDPELDLDEKEDKDTYISAIDVRKRLTDSLAAPKVRTAMWC